MGLYRGEMKTTLLNDKQIRPTEYTKWRHAHDQFARRDKDRVTVDEYKAQLLKGRPVEPITLGIDDRYHDVYVADGHHRAIAHIELGAPEFSFIWYWIRSFGVHMERDPFPYHLLSL